VKPDETADELLARLARLGRDATRAAFDILQADPRTPGTPQDPAGVTYGPKLKKEDGIIRFDQPVAKLAARIRGLWSWPGVVCRFVSADGLRDEQVMLARAVPYEGRAVPAASEDDLGRITDVLAFQGPDREMTILEIKPANGKLMDWRSFVNGRHVRPGDRLMPLAPQEP
jgi:methionyl-tRNA formyltransferase